LQYEVRGTDSSFFVDDSWTADKLASVDRKIATYKGFRVCYGLIMGVCVCLCVGQVDVLQPSGKNNNINKYLLVLLN
jgi:hypothetical protein